MENTSLKLKIVFFLFFLFIILFSIIGYVVISRQYTIQKENMVNAARSFTVLSSKDVIRNYELYYDSGFIKLVQVYDELAGLSKDLYGFEIYNIEGKLLFYSDEIYEGKKEGKETKINSSQLKEKLRSPDTTIREINFENKAYLEIIYPYYDEWRRHDYSLRYIYSYKSLEENLYQLIINTIISIIILFILSFFILYYFSSKIITTPLIKLTEVVKEIGNKNYQIRTSIESKDEIGLLAKSVNSMAEKILESKKFIEQQNLSLEKTVEEKTMDLSKKIEELESVKIAVLNILEDSDDTNKELAKAKILLSEKIKQLETIDKEKDEFISVTAHELKTPLTSIKGFTTLLKDEKVINNKEMRKKYFNIIVEDTDRLGRLIGDILDLSRLDLGTMKFNIEETTAEELTENVKNLCDLVIKNKKIKSIYNIEKGLPKLLTDKSRITQVISNLFNNSIKYTEKGFIKLEIFKKEKIIHFRVTDTGVGIPKNSQARIFERFYQADSSYTRKVGGSGLGLSICKGIVGALGGKIWFKSAEGKGTMFEFQLPIKPPFEEKTQNINILKDNPNK